MTIITLRKIQERERTPGSHTWQNCIGERVPQLQGVAGMLKNDIFFADIKKHIRLEQSKRNCMQKQHSPKARRSSINKSLSILKSLYSVTFRTEEPGFQKRLPHCSPQQWRRTKATTTCLDSCTPSDEVRNDMLRSFQAEIFSAGEQVPQKY